MISDFSLRQQLVKNVMSISILKLITIPITLLVSILLARALGPDAYGQYIFVLSVISLLAIPVGTGMGQFITREIAGYIHDNDWGHLYGLLIRARQWVCGGALVLIVVVGLISYQYTKWTMESNNILFIVGSILIPILGLSTIQNGTLCGLRKVVYAEFSKMIIQPGLHLLMVVFLILSGFIDQLSAISSNIISSIGGLLFTTIILKHVLIYPSKNISIKFNEKEWIRALLPFTLLTAVGLINIEIGILFLGLLGNDAQVSALRVAQSGALFVPLSLIIINMVITPHITYAHRANDHQQLQVLFQQSARFAFATALPIAIPFLLFGEIIIEFIYGVEYAELALWPFLILVIGQLINVAFGSVGIFLTMCGYERDCLNGQIIALFVNVLVAVLLIPNFGAIGAAIAVSSGLITWNAILAIKLKQRLNLRPTAF